MQRADLFLVFTAPLEHENIRHMVSGSVASMVYGEPRLTNDIDIVLELAPADAGRIAHAYGDDDFYRPPTDVIVVEAARTCRGHFNLIHHETGFKADIYLAGTDPLHAWALDRRRRIDLSAQGHLWIAPPEYVILRKLEYYGEGGSEKHRADILGMLEVSGDLIDRDALESWIRRLGWTETWARIDRGMAGS